MASEGLIVKVTSDNEYPVVDSFDDLGLQDTRV